MRCASTILVPKTGEEGGKEERGHLACVGWEEGGLRRMCGEAAAADDRSKEVSSGCVKETSVDSHVFPAKKETSRRLVVCIN